MGVMTSSNNQVYLSCKASGNACSMALSAIMFSCVLGCYCNQCSVIKIYFYTSLLM